MRWFDGDIAAAVNLAKSKSAIFVVFCAGNDENSKHLTDLINDASVSAKLKSDSFVAIRIESDKPEYIQFSQIYQLVPVPSLFFIRNGIPAKVVTSAVKSSSELLEAIDGVINIQTQAAGAVPAEGGGEEKKVVEVPAARAAEPEIVCDGDKCYKKEPEAGASTKKISGEDSVAAAAGVESKEETEEEKQEKVKRAMKLIEEKRIERIQEEQRLEKEREIRRRQEGQEVQKLKKWQDDQEMQKLQDERKREKMAAAEARKRVLQQIEEDKKERARRFNLTQGNEEQPAVKKTEPAPPATTPTAPPNSARIQFKKPDGESEVVTFDSDIPFADLHSFVKSDILGATNIREFVLATTFPRREFSEADFNKSLIELNLAPTSVILIIPGKKAAPKPNTPSAVLPTQTDGSIFDMLGALIMGLFSPVFALFAYLKNLAFRPRNNSADGEEDYGKRKRDEETLMPNDAAKKRNMDRFMASQSEPATSSQESGAIPKAGTYKRINPSSNIHRLHQDSDSEDDEERKTYNGNSTQQM